VTARYPISVTGGSTSDVIAMSADPARSVQ
jgi:hypothetical protein